MRDLERIYIAYLTEPREVGVSSKHSPQHLTLVPTFEPNLSMAVDAVEEVQTMFDPFEVHATRQAMFGPDYDIPVYLVEPIDDLVLLHAALVTALEKRKMDLTHTRYIRDEFQPHIAIKANSPGITEGQNFLVDHLAVMGKGENVRTVLAKMVLGKSNDGEKLRQ